MHRKNPTLGEKLSFIKMYALDTCTVPWRFYLETGGNALNNLAITALYLDMGDLVRSFFRPKLERTIRHSARSRNAVRNYHPDGTSTEVKQARNVPRKYNAPLLPEVSDLIAEHTRFEVDPKRPVYSNGFQHIWEIDTAMQKHLGRWVIFNMGVDFAYDWWSAIIKDPRSKCSLGRFAVLLQAFGLTNQAYRTPLILDTIYKSGPVTILPTSVLLEEGTWLVGLDIPFKTLIPGDVGDTTLPRLWLGEDPHWAGCGEFIEVTLPPVNKSIYVIGHQVIKAPERARYRVRSEDASLTNPIWWPGAIFWGFRLA